MPAKGRARDGDRRGAKATAAEDQPRLKAAPKATSITGQARVVRNARAPTYDELVEQMRGIDGRLRRRKLTVASAESCTGGLLGAVLSEVPGSSDHYLGGAVAYSNDAKSILADVAPDLIHGHGAVSSVVAAALARGARQRLGAKIGLGITGIAGPTGATPGKPVGLTYVAVDSDRRSSVRTCRFGFDRAGNRLASVAAALGLLEEAIG